MTKISVIVIDHQGKSWKVKIDQEANDQDVLEDILEGIKAESGWYTMSWLKNANSVRFDKPTVRIERLTISPVVHHISYSESKP